MSINTIAVDGNIGREIEYRTVGDKTRKASFSIGHTVYGKNKETDWFNCHAFGGLVDVIEKLNIAKGDYVAVTGRMRVQKYDNKDGEQVTYPHVIITGITVKSRNPDSQGEDVPF